MEVQAVLEGPTGRGARSRSILAASVPVVMLAVVIGVGSLGRVESRSDDDAPAPTPAQTSRRVPILDSSRPAPLAISMTSVDALASSDDARFPTRALGVPAWSVGDSVELFLAGALTDRLVAIGGWLSFPGGRPTCMYGADATGPGGDLCPRRAILTVGASPSRLSLQFPPGVSLDGVLPPSGSWTDASFPVPVVVLGGGSTILARSTARLEARPVTSGSSSNR